MVTSISLQEPDPPSVKSEVIYLKPLTNIQHTTVLKPSLPVLNLSASRQLTIIYSNTKIHNNYDYDT